MSKPNSAAPRVPAGPKSLASLARGGAQSRVEAITIAYKRAYAVQDDVDQLLGAVTTNKIALFPSVGRIASAAMHEPPSSIEDVMLQIAVASAWHGMTIDGLEEGSLNREVALAIDSVLQNALRFLCHTQGDAAIEGEALELLNKHLAEAVGDGAAFHERIAA